MRSMVIFRDAFVRITSVQRWLPYAMPVMQPKAINEDVEVVSKVILIDLSNIVAFVSRPAETNVFKIVKMIMERNLAPVIVFSFSKKDCETYACAIAKLDFNSG
jgi:superfamily II RNA helicase